jgi:hypothetical protein
MGACVGTENWRLVPGNGRAMPVQTRVLDRWRDGTVRWLLVDSTADTDPGRDVEAFLESGASEPLPVAALAVSADSGSVAVDTGAVRYVVRAGGAFPFQSADIAGRPGADAGGSGLRITDSQGTVRPAVIRSVQVEEEGPLRTVVLVKGTAPGADAKKSLDVTARMHFFAGSPAVRLLVTLTNPHRAVHAGNFWDLGDPGSILVKDVSLTLALAGAGASEMLASAELGLPASACRPPFELYQDSSGGEQWQSTNHINRERRVPTTFRGYRLRAGGEERSGLRATPIVHLRGAGGHVAVTVPSFWQNFPMAIEAGESSVMLRFFPGQYSDLHEIQGGEQKTHECFVAFGTAGLPEEAILWCRSRVVPSVDPEWVMASGAVPFLAPLDATHGALVNAAIEGPDRFELKREVIDEYGWRHFGEIYGDHESVFHPSPPLVSHYNNQYDPVAGFASQFLRTGDPRWWTMAAELAWHVMDIDVYHTTEDKSAYNHGMFWHTYHYGDADTATHRTYPLAGKGHIHGGGPSADHNYTSGLMLEYYLTGDTAFRQAVIDLGQYVVDLEDGRKTVFRWLDPGDTGRATLSAGYYGPGRGPANSVNALLDAHRVSGEARFLAKAEQLIRRVVHPREDIARHGLDHTELRWFYLMFLQSLGKYLHLKVERGELDRAYAYGRDTLLHYADWMASHEYPYLDKPEKLEFPTETWAAQDTRKSDVFHYAAMHAADGERARFDERGRFFHRYSLQTLQSMPTRALARPVVVLLTSGFLDPWRQAHQAALEPEPDGQWDPGPVEVFVPQRLRAERRAKRLAVALLASGLLAGAVWFLS